MRPFVPCKILSLLFVLSLETWGGGACDGNMCLVYSAFSPPGSGVEPECCCEEKVTAVAGPAHPCPLDDPWRWDSLAEATRCPIGDRPEPAPASDGGTRAGIPSPHPPTGPSAPTKKLNCFFFLSLLYPPPRRRSASVRAAAVGWLHCTRSLSWMSVPQTPHSAQSQISSHHQHSTYYRRTRMRDCRARSLNTPGRQRCRPPALVTPPSTIPIHQPTPSGGLLPHCC